MTGPRMRIQANTRGDAMTQVDAMLVNARELFASANLAHARGDTDAVHKTRDALAALEDARRRLALIADQREEQR